jgi:poly(3-hydroxybutyrate) depolymerase
LKFLGRVVICSLLLLTAAQGADVSEFMDFSLRNPRGQLTMPARLHVPPAAIADPVTKRPLIVWLHGGGDAGTNNLNQIRWDVDFLFAEAKRRGAFLLAPQAPLNWRPKSVTDNVVSLLNLATNQFNVDPDRLYLTGYSSGGGGTWNMLSRYPDMFAAGMPVAPVSAEPDFIPANLVGQAISVFHARNDTVAPVQTTRNVINSIMSAAGHALPTYPPPTGDHFGFAAPELDFWYFEPRNGDHSFHFNVYGSNPIIYDWMFSHSLAVPEPASLVASLAMISIVGLARRRSLCAAA